ncbi:MULTISPECIES: hypothetical protein [unclassified Sphingomonas]|jgi:hypothetical protein|uniref:hypothetical protein n=1 Tax=unclassified Sphingomonas TaxID=196159 RepID=UPI0002EE797E|nr:MULTISPECIES: hypothetical protein [unclassified Sphingomonas]KTF67874.1 hypothetical protein ATB93_16275 [Sphingomonas sp. WG]
MSNQTLLPLRGTLASFENAYAVAVQLRAASGAEQFVVATGNDVQPFRVTPEPPLSRETFLACVA